MATDDDDAATLRERVRELEQTVAQQQDTIQQLLPSRRAVLAGGAGLVGGVALTGQASAQSAAGQIGTSSEPVNVEAAEVTADSVNTEKLVIGGTLYELDGTISVSNLSETTYSVSGDFDVVIVVFDPAGDGFDQLQVNGDTGSNYDTVDTSDSQRTGQTHFDVQRTWQLSYLEVKDTGSLVSYGSLLTRGGTAKAYRGSNLNLGGNGINELKFIDSGNTNRSMDARVYGRSV